MRTTRRRLLRSGTAVLSTGGVVAVAGCPGQSGNGTSSGRGTDGEGDSGSTTSDGTTTGEIPWYATWMPTREAARLDGLPLTDNYEFVAVEPKALVEHRDALPEETASQLDAKTGYGFGTLSSFRRLLQLPGGTVVVGPYDRSQVTDRLKQKGMSESGSKGGYTLYTGDEDGRAAAFAEGTAILTGTLGIESDRLPVAKAIIDAKAGTAPRYYQSDASVKRLVTAVGEADTVQGLTHGPDEGISGAVASGLGIDVGASTTNLRTAVVFPPGKARTGPVTEWAKTAPLVSKVDPDVSKSGDVVFARGSLPTGDLTPFRTEFASDQAVEPEVEFTFDYESVGNREGTLEVTHAGGNTVSRSALYIRGTGFADVDGVDQTSAGRWQGSASGEEGAVVAGDSVVLGVTSEYEISVVWEDGDRSVIFATDNGPDA